MTYEDIPDNHTILARVLNSASSYRAGKPDLYRTFLHAALIDCMKVNRSIPSSTVIPVLVYPDVPGASEWIVSAFGFRERLRVGAGHRSQLTYGDGAVILAEASLGRRAPGADDHTHSVTVRVEDARSHFEQARQAGAVITSEPADTEFGERQYSAVDPWGHHWTFSESIADKAPEDWGGTPANPG